ncbi:Repeat domain-containing protein [Chitinophaga costaii]|uniref:Repeat domain-containing protein n=1 Tax=Chitinophaga costaii TaxID=1335309 RepID=A0A1C4FU53_9BACT|nr:VCBS repeat-containing protein [Chitinophaga costaii]PUZ27210.1 VCBS repeat-containing protein [Chitinophaga costaii]SCC59402.1 Repeat domain-containing protein [Chitinophaga costaii]
MIKRFLIIIFCGGILSTQAQEKSWKMHVIDNSLLGADGVKLADANNDGFKDIVTGWEQSGLVRIYFNPGPARSKEKWKYVTVGRAPSVEDAVLVDLDGDGAKDVISCSEGHTLSINIHWAPPPGQDYTDSSLWSTASIPVTKNLCQWMFAVPIQLDNKNGIDLVIGGKKDNDSFPQPYIGWLQSPKNPRNLADWKWISLAKVSWVMSIFTNDINNDGLPDIVYSDRKGDTKGCWWLENPGEEHIAEHWQKHNIGGDTTHTEFFMDLGDLDGDQRTDVLAATLEDSIHFIRKMSDDGLQWKTYKISYPMKVGSAKGITIADLDGDGKKELVLSFEHAYTPNSGIVYLKSSRSVYDKGWLRNEISGPNGIKYDLIPDIDLDGDGDPDIISTEENNNSANGNGGLGIIWYENPGK